VVWFVCRVLCVVRAGRLGLEWEEGRLRGGGGRCLCEGRGGRAVALGWLGGGCNFERGAEEGCELWVGEAGCGGCGYL